MPGVCPAAKSPFMAGILPYTENETGMAVVIGREVAHALARHGNERFSQNLLHNLGTSVLVRLAEADRRRLLEVAFESRTRTMCFCLPKPAAPDPR